MNSNIDDLNAIIAAQQKTMFQLQTDLKNSQETLETYQNLATKQYNCIKQLNDCIKQLTQQNGGLKKELQILVDAVNLLLLQLETSEEKNDNTSTANSNHFFSQ